MMMPLRNNYGGFLSKKAVILLSHTAALQGNPYYRTVPGSPCLRPAYISVDFSMANIGFTRPALVGSKQYAGEGFPFGMWLT